MHVPAKSTIYSMFTKAQRHFSRRVYVCFIHVKTIIFFSRVGKSCASSHIAALWFRHILPIDICGWGFPNPATICSAPSTRHGRRSRVMTRQVFHNAVIGVVQIALVAKSNNLYFYRVGAIAKMYRSTIITTYIIFFFDLVAGFGNR